MCITRRTGLVLSTLSVVIRQSVLARNLRYGTSTRSKIRKCEEGSTKVPLDPTTIPKWEEHLIIPPVLYDDNAEVDDHRNRRNLEYSRNSRRYRKSSSDSSTRSKDSSHRGSSSESNSDSTSESLDLSHSYSYSYSYSFEYGSYSDGPYSHSSRHSQTKSSKESSTGSGSTKSSSTKKSYGSSSGSSDSHTGSSSSTKSEDSYNDRLGKVPPSSSEMPFQIGVRQIMQQVLPSGFPETKLWAYGDPDDEETFFNPSFTMEVTKDKTTHVAWINELVNDPVKCRCDPYDDEACSYIEHVLQDRDGKPIVDQTLHWANPPQECKMGPSRTDCRGTTTNPYHGPIPMVIHLHGAHTNPESDGYPEAWTLPWRASNVDNYATGGKFYHEPSQSIPIKTCAKEQHLEGTGFTVSSYANDQPTGNLWYHDHSLGITRLNVYAAAAGMWFIREEDGGESGLRHGTLPGPPPVLGDEPNDLSGRDRKKIREIPIVIQPKSFYCDGSLFYPANRASFEDVGNDGSLFADNPEISSGLVDPFNGGVSPIFNPEAFFNTMVVNGKTWPKLEVAPVRYRFRILNAADSRHLNLAIFENGDTSKDELPFYVIGSDLSLLPNVVKISTGKATVLPGDGTEPKKDADASSDKQALLLGPAERYDVIVDFTGLKDGDEYIMINTGPDEPFGGFEDTVPADPETTGQVMKFVVNTKLGRRDESTEPKDLLFDKESPGGQEPVDIDNAKVRDLALLEEVTDLCAMNTGDKVIEEPNAPAECGEGFEPFGPLAVVLGTEGSDLARGEDAVVQLWDAPVTETPKLGAVEVWEFWNGSADAHPMHVHLVEFNILSRQKFDATDPERPLMEKRPPEPYETGWKDVVISYPGEVTRVAARFDIQGLFVWHCHILSHEDNEMMRPFCVGDTDCGLS